MTPTISATLSAVISVFALYFAGRAALTGFTRIFDRPEPGAWIAGKWKRASPLFGRFAKRYPKASTLIAARLDIHRFKGFR